MALTKADEFRIDRIEQRENFLNMRLDQDKELGAIFERIADDITARIETEEDPDIIDAYRQATKDLHKHLEDNFTYYTSEFVKEGTRVEQLRMETMVKAADIEALTTAGINDIFVRINTDAVAAAWHNSKYGLNLSQRIWNTSENAKETIGNIITTGVAAGDDVVDVARQLEAYILHGRSTAAELYPNMMKRMGDKRIPEEISYEALRLARTEMTRAFGDATLRAAREDPSTIGVQFELSSSHPVYDICDVHTAADDYGLGKGTYPLDAAPDYPFHPNCLCIMTMATEDTDAFIARLQAWAEDPDTQPDIEKWYEDKYGGSSKNVETNGQTRYNVYKDNLSAAKKNYGAARNEYKKTSGYKKERSVINKKIKDGTLDQVDYDRYTVKYKGIFKQPIKTIIGDIKDTQDRAQHVIANHLDQVQQSKLLDRIDGALRKPGMIIKTTDRNGTDSYVFFESEVENPIVAVVDSHHNFLTAFVADEDWAVRKITTAIKNDEVVVEMRGY